MNKLDENSLSIIIPTLNEELFIGRTLQRIYKCAQNEVEIIVIDAGSTDFTQKEVKRFGKVRFYQDQNFLYKKYTSLNKGAELANGDVLLFLDADTLVPNRFDELILETLKGRTVGGAFELSFDRYVWFLKLVEIGNKIRYRITKRYFGDQAIFCFRSAFDNVGGYPHLPIMEAAHFCSKLKKVGQLKLIKTSVISSSRRFFKYGHVKVFLFDLKIYLRDLMGISIKSMAVKYWSKN